MFELILACAGMIAVIYTIAVSCLILEIGDRLRKQQSLSPNLRIVAILAYSLAGATTLCIAYGYFVEPYWVEVTTIEIETEKLANTSLRIVLISDTHCDETIRNELTIPQMVNAIDPDLIVFTGDAVNEYEATGNFRTMMSSMKAKIGKFAVHGIWDDNRENSPLFTDTGFLPLLAETQTLSKDGEAFNVTGISYSFTDGYRRALTNRPSDRFTLFLHHTPDLIEDLSDLSVDLYLAGHTHGGQVALPFYGALMTLSKFGKKYEAGQYQVGHTTLYVNRGIGMEGGYAPRVRFLARPEITVFNIRSKHRRATAELSRKSGTPPLMPADLNLSSLAH